MTLNTAGTQSVTATDTATGTITGTQSGITVNKSSTTLSTSLSAGTITVGATAHDSSTITGLVNSTGTGTVAYSYYTNNTCTANAVTVGSVTVPTSGTVPNSPAATLGSVGTYYWQAVYSGDSNNNGASSPCTATNNEQLIVNKTSPTIATTLSVTSIAMGATAHDSSTITGLVNSSGIAGVTYSYYTNNTCTANPVTVNTVTVATNGTVPNSSTVTFNNAGTYYWQAVYSGDANNNGASSPCTATNNELLTVNKASPSITTSLSASSIIAGTTAHDSSTITGLVNSTGTGTVTYSYYTNNTCTANAVTVGSVTVPTSGTVPNSPAATLGSVGTYYWQAVYSGDSNNNGASSTCTFSNNEKLTVTIASPTIATSLSSGSILAGTTAYDTSTLSGAGNSTGAGTVTYSYYTNNTCTTGHITVGAVTVPTSGAVPNSSTVTFNSVNTYYWQAVYSGDANNNGATSPCTATNNEQLTVAKGAPTLSTTLSSASITAGQTAHDTSALSGAGTSTGTGTVAYSYYTNNTCTTGVVAVNTVTVPTSGAVPNSSTVTFNSAGTYYWQAIYSGDANNNGATSPCTATNNEQLIVNKTSPTIATTLSVTSIAMGATAHDSSTITGLVNSSGIAGVTYSYYTNNTCTANPVTVNTVTVATNGTVPNSSTVTFNNAGTYYWQAVYSGDANNNGASSPCTATNNELLTVNKASPSITTSLSASSIIAGTTAHDSSTITGLVNSTGTGTVTYSYYTNNTCTANAVTVGSVTVPTSGTVPNSPAATLGSVGTYYWQAVYSGDSNNNGASSTCTFSNNEKLTVTIASPTIATSLSSGSILAGTTAYDTSTLSGAGNSTGAGTVTYSYYTNNTCTTGHITVGAVTVPTSGAVPNSSTVTFNSVNTYYWQAVYSGDANNNGATSPCTATNNEQLTVAKGAPTLTATGPGTGTAGTAIAATNISSVLAASSGANATGTITITVFGPQASAPTTCTSGGTTVGTATVAGNATYHPSAGYTPTGAGDYWWYASYGGDANNTTATSTCGSTMSETTVGQAAPTLTATGPGTGTIGTAIAASSINSVLAASSGANATGTITITVFGPQASAPTTCTSGGTTVGTATVAGNATYHPSAGYTPTGAGDYWWYASYGGDANNSTATSTCGSTMSETTVAKFSPTVTATGPGTATIGTAIAASSINSVLAGGTTAPAVSGTITITVFGPQASAPTTCTSGGTTVGTATVAGNATYHPSAGYTPTGAGDYWWYASYGGDANNSTATSTCGSTMSETTVAKFSPTVTAGGPGTGTAGTAIAASSINSVLAGGTTAPAVSGTITIKVFGPQASAPTTCTSGGTTVGTGTTVSGNATYNPSAGYTPTAIGDYWWYASYGGDANNSTATSTCGSTMSETTVGQAAPTVTATGPGTGTAGTAITTANISSVLAASSGANATGTITFKVFGPQASAPTTCTSGGTTVGTATVAGNATYHPSAAYTPGAIGDYWWYASYGGDANNTTATSTCGSTMSETTVGQAVPTITATGPGTGTAGTAIAASSINSVLAGGTTAPAVSGTITITVFGPQASAPTTCTSGGTTVGTATVAGNATYHPSAAYTPGATGDYWWYASYGGDANNTTATSTCGSTMSETTVGQGRPDADGDRPGDGHDRDGYRSELHQLGAGGVLGRERHRHHHHHGLRSPGQRPDHLHQRGHDGGHGHGRRATPPITRRPATRRRVQVTTGGTPPTAATPTTTRRPRPAARRCPRRRWPSSPRRSRPAARGPAPPARPSRRAPSTRCSRRHHRPGGERHHHHHRLRAPGHAPRPPAPPGARRSAPGHGAGQRHLQPVGRLHAERGGDYWWYASYGGDANNNTATRPVARRCPRRWWARPPRR